MQCNTADHHLSLSWQNKLPPLRWFGIICTQWPSCFLHLHYYCDPKEGSSWYIPWFVSNWVMHPEQTVNQRNVGSVPSRWPPSHNSWDKILPLNGWLHGCEIDHPVWIVSCAVCKCFMNTAVVIVPVHLLSSDMEIICTFALCWTHLCSSILEKAEEVYFCLGVTDRKSVV